MKGNNYIKSHILSCTFFISLCFISSAQVQIGNVIYGDAEDDWAGYSISMPDNQTVAISSPYNSEYQHYSGQVRIFKYLSNNWIQKGSDIFGEAMDDLSGFSVHMPDSNTVAIGSPYNCGNGGCRGHVRVYSWNGSLWIQTGTDIEGENINDQSGYSVYMPDNKHIAIGSPHLHPNDTNAGQVRIFKWSGIEWTQKGLSIEGENPGDQFGWSVCMPDSNTIAIGAVYNSNILPESGHVRIFFWNGISWIQKGTDINGEAAYDFSGISIHMPDSNTIAIGATGSDGTGIDAGHARIFHWNGTTWVQKGNDIDGEATGDGFGLLFMPDSNTIAIAAPLNDNNGNNSGSVSFYKWDGNEWIQKCAPINGANADDWAGFSISMPDINTIAIGAINNSDSLLYAGHVRIFSLCNTYSEINPVACISYTSPSGNHVWTSSGIYYDTIPNTAGCDSLITVNLTIHTVDVSVTNTSPTLTANASGATYQWLDCNNSMAIIPGETAQSFTALSNGSYAVQVAQNSCTDTSDCEAVTNAGILENSFGNALTVYPNPTKGEIYIDLGVNYIEALFIVRNELGQEVMKKSFYETGVLHFNIPGEAGIYFVEIMANDKRAILRVMKE